MNAENLILLFNSVHYVLKAEKLLIDAGFTVKTKPVPRQLSSDCGICLLIEKASPNAVLKSLPSSVKPNTIYRIQNKDTFIRLYPSP